MKNKKIKLEDLKVQSFVTALGKKDNSTLPGGGGIAPPPGLTAGCNYPPPPKAPEQEAYLAATFINWVCYVF